MLTLSLLLTTVIAPQTGQAVQPEPAMQPAKVTVGSKLEDTLAAQGFAPSTNFPKPLTTPTKDKGLVITGGGTGCRGTIGDTVLSIVNYSDEVIWFPAQDSRLDIIREAMTKDGKWKPIEYLMQSTCGNSFHRVALGPREYWQVNLGKDHGTVATQVRFRFNLKGKTLYSSPYPTTISANAFQLPKEYSRYEFRDDGFLAFRP